MYKISWDKQTGGVILHSDVTPDTLGITPRPVFWEELDLLKLYELGWTYPHSDEPLLWACNKQYFYRGTLVFEAKGANLYDPATVIFHNDADRGQNLQPVDVAEMLRRNKDFIFLLESEAIEFIRDTYLQYSTANRATEHSAANQLDYNTLLERAERKAKKKMAIVKEDCDSFDIVPLDTARESGKRIYQTTKIDRFLASFSGGKDSQVVLDLCTRAIPSTDFEVIYSDTGYELPPSLQLYEDTRRHYTGLYPDLRFSVARNHDSVLNYWDKIGTPSDTHRWCCSVMKTAPLYRMLKSVNGRGGKRAKILTFDGVRAEESTRRSSYQRIGKGVKHNTVINARPILSWNTTEIFLYLFYHELPINIAYRQGMTRVGCLLCPFANEWNERIAQIHYPEKVRPFLTRIEKFAKSSGVKDIHDYVSSGGWKRRASGNLVEQNTFISFKSSTPNLIAKIKNPNSSILSFLSILGDYTVCTENRENLTGEIRINNRLYDFQIKTAQSECIFTLKNISDPIVLGMVKRVLYKSTYCIQCEACEVECPTGALSIYPITQIDKAKCIHCHKCLTFHEKGCIVANSLYITNGNTMNSKAANIDRYRNFGLKEEWLTNYLMELDDFWNSNHGLNENYQIPALKAWLRDAELIDDKNNATELAKLLASNDVYTNHPNLMWEIVWINLAYNSFIVNWFVNNITPQIECSQKMMEEMIGEQYSSYKAKTIHNAVYQLRRLLKESPIGSTLGQCVDIRKDIFMRKEFDSLSEEAITYSVYKYADQLSVTTYRVSDIYRPNCEHGVGKEFCYPRTEFERVLRQLTVDKVHVLNAELNMGLDHITLRDDLNAITALKLLLNV